MSKNILITPSPTGYNPTINFSGDTANIINLEVLPDGNIQFKTPNDDIILDINDTSVIVGNDLSVYGDINISGITTLQNVSVTTLSADTIYTHTISGMSPVNINDVIVENGTILATSMTGNTLIINNNVGIGTTNPTEALELGTTMAGKNQIINATVGPNIFYPPIEASGWTLGYDAGVGGWSVSGGKLIKTPSTNNLLAQCTSDMGTITPGKTYKVVITVEAYGGGGVVYPYLGSVGLPSFASIGTFTSYIVAGSSQKLSFNPAGTTNTMTISNIEIYELSQGDLTVWGKISAYGQMLGGDSGGYPFYSFKNAPTSGLAYISSEGVCMIAAGQIASEWSSAGLVVYPRKNIQFRTGTYLWGDVLNELALRQGTAQQYLKIYNTYTNATNYERCSIGGVIGSSINIAAETAGTGADNLNIVLTPAGTGYNILNGDVIISGKTQITSSVQIGDDTTGASSINAGAIRYRSDSNNSYCEMVMQTGSTEYGWVIIKQNTW